MSETLCLCDRVADAVDPKFEEKVQHVKERRSMSSVSRLRKATNHKFADVASIARRARPDVSSVRSKDLNESLGRLQHKFVHLVRCVLEGEQQLRRRMVVGRGVDECHQQPHKGAKRMLAQMRGDLRNGVQNIVIIVIHQRDQGGTSKLSVRCSIDAVGDDLCDTLASLGVTRQRLSNQLRAIPFEGGMRRQCAPSNARFVVLRLQHSLDDRINDLRINVADIEHQPVHHPGGQDPVLSVDQYLESRHGIRAGVPKCCCNCVSNAGPNEDDRIACKRAEMRTNKLSSLAISVVDE